ncbi:protein O-linked-mannose beta-1,2-N-acetylglucosaminyltransferase 1-like [Scylla paramamosain]|uniref:protein O-linked-mannose beta-1,2-N-acetylglucosaminyltransferase 1-like n=1 Tax=Scylla paramamosain TaxID=85552 RepID=UPI003082710A
MIWPKIRGRLCILIIRITPMHRRAVLNGGGGGGGECDEVEQLKEAMEYVMQIYPGLKYLLLLETGLSLSPDFVSFFTQALPALQTDPSLYCLSAASPLSLPLHPGNASRLHRVDHFVGGATLLPRRLLEEIVQEFVVYEDGMRGGGGGGEETRRTSMEWLTEWLSWWGRRYRRGCAVPDEPRVCSLHHTPAPNTHPCSARPTHALAATVDISRLLHYKYSQDVYWDISAAVPLGGSEINCTKPDFFPRVMNESIYIIYFKMENYDDDFTFHHIMKCFGVDLPRAVGYFEGVFQFMFRGKRMLLLGIPYSRFSPSIKNHNALIVADIPKRFVHGQTNYLRNRHVAFSFNTVLVMQGKV